MKHFIGGLILSVALFLTGCQSAGAQQPQQAATISPTTSVPTTSAASAPRIISLDADQTCGEERCSTSGSV